jgi:hypothetical protein
MFWPDPVFGIDPVLVKGSLEAGLASMWQPLCHRLAIVAAICVISTGIDLA